MKLTENFDSEEFACPCCGKSEMEPDFMIKLQALRDMYLKPIKVVKGGGYRCKDYPSSYYSAHKEGRAVDPGIPQEDLFDVVCYALDCGFTGIGIKNSNGRWQLHLDDAEMIPSIRPRPWLWTYQ